MTQKETKKGVRSGEELYSTGAGNKVELIVHGEEMVERIVKLSGNSGRVYPPVVWAEPICIFNILRAK